jgi:transposase InsO family protein
MKYLFIEAEKANYPVDVLCDVLEVSRSGYYAWRTRKPSARFLANQELVAEIRRIHVGKQRCYGSPRVHSVLRSSGVRAGRHRVARLMQREGIRASTQPRFVVTTDSDHELEVAPNLLERRFVVDAANKTWVGDITYIPTREGWLYLAVVIDLFSRRVVGWAADNHMRATLAVDALQRALDVRRPDPGLVFHSDRGIQYASVAFKAVLERHGAVQSMSRAGDCWDNAPAESFFSSLKREHVDNEHYASRHDAKRSLFDYIELFYNSKRLHSSLGYASPLRYEQQTAA